MPKQDHILDELHRLVGRLARLEGGVLIACLEGPHLVWPAVVLDPRPLIESLRVRGLPTVGALCAAVRMDRPPLAFGPFDLAAAHRDLSRAATLTSGRDVVRLAPRLARKHRGIGADWLRARQAQLDLLGTSLRAAPELVEGTGSDPRALLEAALRVARALHGDDNAWIFSAVLEARRSEDCRRREQARVRVDRLADAVSTCTALAPVDGEPAELTAALSEAARSIRALATTPGRARVKQLRDALRAALFWPSTVPKTAAPAIPSGAAGAALVDAVRAIGAALVTEVGAPLVSDAVTAHTASCFALCFPVAGGRGPVDAEEAASMCARMDDALAHLAGTGVSFEQALTLLRLELSGRDLHKLAGWVARGLSCELVDGVALAQRLAPMLELDDVRAAKPYARWAMALAPVYGAHGIELVLPPRLFLPARATRSASHAVLASCLLSHHLEPTAAGGAEAAPAAETRAPPELPRADLTVLDAVLAVFGEAANDVVEAIRPLRSTERGLGRAREPELAEWLADDALLDEYLHLCRLAGEPVQLSANLRRDHLRDERRAREQAHLEALVQRSELQDKRLATLRADAAPPCPAQTRRRLAARVQELWPMAWRRTLERALLLALRRAYGIRLQHVSAGWLAALRYLLIADDNERLLSTLLRFAAGHPGRDAASAVPRARRWIETARARFDVDAFRAPRARELCIDGVTYRLATEQDPVEVLRMGIPFDTCLSLLEGCNAASTVANAIDPNKLVLYLRDASGSIVGRKLLCVSKRFELLGYRVYSSLGEQHQATVDTAFDALARDIAAAAGLRLGTSGEPESVHGGFWYDDGALPFDADSTQRDVAAYCQRLGRPVPAGVDHRVEREARGWAALDRGDLTRAIDLLDEWPSAAAELGLADGVVQRLGEPEAARLAIARIELVVPLLRAAARRGPRQLMRAAAALAMHPSRMGDAVELLGSFASGLEVATALVRGATAAMRHPFDDDGLEHQSLTALPQQAPFLETAALLALCDEVEPAWARAARAGCADCRDRSVDRLMRAAEVAYARARDPDAVIACLRDRRRSALAHRVALCLAARFTLPPRGAPRPADGIGEAAWKGALGWLDEAPRASPTVVGALDKLLQLRPPLAKHPHALAAMLRHCHDPARAMTLPTNEAPFEALGALQLHCGGLETLLDRWSTPDVAPSAWKPGRWELGHHRRHATVWRQRLERAAQRNGAEALAAVAWLGMVGDLDALERLERRLSSSPADSGAEHAVGDAIARAKAVRAQLEGGDADSCMPARMAWAATTVDPAFARRALARVATAIDAGAPPTDAAPSLPESFDLDRALEVLWQTADAERGWLFVEAALASGSPPEPVTRHAGRILQEHSRSWIGAVRAELLIETWQVPSLRDALCTALLNADADPCGPLWTRIDAAARGAPPHRGIAGLFDRWVATRVAADRARFLGHAEAPLLRRAMMAIRRGADPKAWLTAYRALTDLASGAMALADLENAWRSGGPGLAAPDAGALSDACAAAAWTTGVQPSLKTWLEMAIAAELARIAAAPTPAAEAPATAWSFATA